MRTNQAPRQSREGHVPHQHPNRRREFLEFITSFITANHFSPTVREIGGHFNVANATVKHYLNDLRANGEIDWADGKQRTIHLTSNGAPAGVSETREETACEPASAQRRSQSPSASRRAQAKRKHTTTTEA